MYTYYTIIHAFKIAKNFSLKDQFKKYFKLTKASTIKNIYNKTWFDPILVLEHIQHNLSRLLIVTCIHET